MSQLFRNNDLSRVLCFSCLVRFSQAIFPPTSMRHYCLDNDRSSSANVIMPTLNRIYIWSMNDAVRECMCEHTREKSRQ